MALVSREQLRYAIVIIAILVIVTISWQLITTIYDVPAFIIPSPEEIYRSGFLSNSNLITSNALVTTYETVLGFLAGAALGTVSAAVIHFSKTLRATLYPFLIFLNQLPKSAIAPVLILWFGLGLESKVVISLLVAFFPILINMAAGLASVQKETLDLALSLKASRARTFLLLELPHASPYIFSGLKIGITLALVGAIVGEFVGASAGLGYLILTAEYNLRTPLMFACLIVLGVLGMLLFGLLEGAERLIIPWYHSMRKMT